MKEKNKKKIFQKLLIWNIKDNSEKTEKDFEKFDKLFNK